MTWVELGYTALPGRTALDCDKYRVHGAKLPVVMGGAASLGCVW